MEFAETLKAYIEVGILGLCAVTVILLFYLNFKKNMDREDKIDKKIDKKDDLLNQKSNTFENEMKTLMQWQAEQNQILLGKIIDGVTMHVPSQEENYQLTKISDELDSILLNMLNQTNACRTCVVQYHNGGKGVNRQSFLKMSMTNEQVQVGVKPFMPAFKDQFRAVLAYFVKEINNNGFCYINDIEEIKTIDAGMYEFMKDRNIQAKYGHVIHDRNGMTIGFICIEYTDKSKANLDVIHKVLSENRNTIETLLNLNVVGD